MEKKNELMAMLSEMYHDARLLVDMLAKPDELTNFIDLLNEVRSNENTADNQLDELYNHIGEFRKEGYWHMIDYIRLDLYRLVG